MRGEQEERSDACGDERSDDYSDDRDALLVVSKLSSFIPTRLHMYVV